LAFLVLVIALTACDPIDTPDAPVAVQLDAALVVRFCEPIASSSVLVEYRNPGKSWKTVLLGNGTGKYDEIRVDAPPPGLKVAETSSPTFVEDGEISISLVAKSATAPDLATTIKVPPDGLPADSWLRPDGSITQNPCSK
jgi:hypothetical protein